MFKLKNISYNNICIKNISSIIDYIFFIVFFLFLYTGYVSTTMRTIKWSKDFHCHIQHLLWIIVGLRIILKILNGKLNFKTIFFILSVLVAGIFCYNVNSGYDIVLDVIVLSIGCIDVDYKCLIKIYLITCILVTIHVIVQSKTGVVTDLVYYRDGHIRDSFGFIYPTDFAAHIFFILCAWVTIRQKKCSNIELLSFVFIAILLQIFCQARCSVFSIILVACLVIIARKNHIIISLTNNKYTTHTKQILLSLVPILFSVIMIILGKTKTNNSFIIFLDKLLSTRVRLTRTAFQNYGIKPWGQYIYMQGNGGSTIVPDNYFFIDCSYVNILLRYGIAIFMFTILSIIILIIKNSNNYFIIGIIIIICLHSVIEHHLFEYYYNIFIILPLANFNNSEMKQKNLKYRVKDSCFPLKYIIS